MTSIRVCFAGCLSLLREDADEKKYGNVITIESGFVAEAQAKASMRRFSLPVHAVSAQVTPG